MCGPRSVRNGRVELPVDRPCVAVIILVKLHQPEVEWFGAGCLAPYSGRVYHTFNLNNSHILGVGGSIHSHGKTDFACSGIVREIVVSGK